MSPSRVRSRPHPADFFALFLGDGRFVANVAGAETAVASASASFG